MARGKMDWRNELRLLGCGVLVGWALHASPAAAMQGCSGQFSAAAIRPLPKPLVVALDVRDTTPMNTGLANAFKRGLAESGHPAEPPSPNAALSVTYRIVGLGGSGGGGGSDPVIRDAPLGTGRSWTDPTTSSAIWMRGGQTAALPGMPRFGTSNQPSPSQPQTLFLRAEVRPVGSEQVAWVGVVQCTLQSTDDQGLAHQLGRLIGGAIGKRVDNTPM